MKTKIFKMLTFVNVLLLTGCSSFNKGIIPVQEMNPATVSSMTGEYGITAVNEDSTAIVNWRYRNAFTELNRKLLKDTMDLDILRKYSFKIDVMNKDLIGITYKMDGRNFRTQVFKTKLKKDGYLHLKNKNARCILVPYVCGALDIKKIRLTLDENKNLIFDVYNHRSGAFMVVGFLDGKTRRYRKIYPRLI